MRKIIFLGSGNVATHLSLALKKKGYAILQIYSRSIKNARKLAGKVGADPINRLDKVRKDAEIYIISVKDGAIAEIARKLKLGNKLVVHTSGSVMMDALKDISSDYGVFYPMQTFSRNSDVEISKVPFFIEANKVINEKRLTGLAKHLTSKKNIYRMDSYQRKTAHLAAVFANNFTNHLYSIAEKILHTNRLSFDIVRPLILETAKKVQHGSPSKMQTGPAKRGDKKIITEHLQMLKSYPEDGKIYRLLTKSIAKTVNN